MKNGISLTLLRRLIEKRLVSIVSICMAFAGILLVNTNITHSSELKAHNESDATSEYTGSDYKGNYVYGGAMNLAWNELNENILHEKLRLNTTDKKTLETVDKFNKAIFTKNDLDEASYYIKSGYGQKTVDTINKESRAKFPDKSFGDLQLTLNDKDIIAYAYFLKKVEYVTPFVIDNVSFMSERVKGFRAKAQTQKENVEVLKYWDEDKFIIRLRLKDDSDELILAKGFDMSNPKGIVDEIRKYDTQNLPTIRDNDLFEMPKLHLDYSRNYGEVIKKYLANKGFEDYSIEIMSEKIKFDMDEKGARVENEAVSQWKAYSSSVPKGRHFIFDKPFWVVMKRKNSQNPYFILGVNNVELMEKNIEATVASGSRVGNTGTSTSSNRENKPDNHTNEEKPPKEATAPSLKITVLEEKKAEKVPVEGAGVYLDGKEVGTTDKAGELIIKETIENYHILEVKKSGYFTFKENIEISEYAEDKTVILNPGITSSEEADNGEDEDVPETQEPVAETSEQGTGGTVQETDIPEQNIITWKVSVLKEAGKRKIPVKGAKIFVDDLPFGETDTDGVFKKEVKIGKHILKVESDKFHPFVKEIEISKDADFTEIVLKKRLHSEPEIPEQRTANAPEQRTENKTAKPILKISILGDTGMEQIPVKGARILINGYLCGETDKDGVFTKHERMGEHTLRVERNGFYPVVQKIEFNEYTDSYEIVLKKMSDKR